MGETEFEETRELIGTENRERTSSHARLVPVCLHQCLEKFVGVT